MSGFKKSLILFKIQLLLILVSLNSLDLFSSNKSLRKNLVSLKPKIEEITGSAFFYDENTESFVPVNTGMFIEKPTLFKTGENSELIFSCPGQIAVRISSNAKVVLAPAFENRYEANLRKGTITALLEPNRPADSPRFAVRTFNGVTEAKGTLFAVAEYKGQTYTAVKKGKIDKQTLPPEKPDFSAYLIPQKGNIHKNPPARPTPASKK
jgi:hypothetical protein